MSASSLSKTGGGETDVGADLETLFGAICRLAPELSPQTYRNSVSITIIPALDLNPAYSNCPKTLGLVLRHFRYNIEAPLFYLAIVKHSVDDEHGDDDEGKTMAMVAPELAAGSPFGGMSAAELLKNIGTGLELLLTELRERKIELDEALKSLEKRKRFWSAATLVPLVVLLLIRTAALAAGKVTPASTTATVLESLVMGGVLATNAMNVLDLWPGKMDDERKSLERQKDAVEAMLSRSDSALRLRLPYLKRVKSLLENLSEERVALRAAAAEHLELEVKKKKKTVKKGIKSVRKKVGSVEPKVKAKAVKFLNIIAK